MYINITAHLELKSFSRVHLLAQDLLLLSGTKKVINLSWFLKARFFKWFNRSQTILLHLVYDASLEVAQKGD